MSLDLYADQLTAATESRGTVQVTDPGIFENFLQGGGKTAMRGFARAARGMSMLGSVPFIAADAEQLPAARQVTGDLAQRRHQIGMSFIRYQIGHHDQGEPGLAVA